MIIPNECRENASYTPASQGGGYELLYSGEVSASTTSGSAVELTTIEVPGIADPDSFIYIRIKDKAGQRDGYFYRSDSFFINHGNPGIVNIGARFIFRGTSTTPQLTSVYGSSDGRGVYPFSVNNSINLIKIYTRYLSSAGTIDGTYSVEVYKCAYPNNDSPYN